MQKFLTAAAACLLLSVRLAAQVSISINTTADPRPISPYIYGLNPYHYDNSLTGLNVHEPGIHVSSLRFGGDAVSTYNWEKNVNISYDGSCGTSYSTNSNNTFLAYASGQPSSAYSQKAGAILKFYSDAAGINAYPLLQLTAMQYAANDAAGCLGGACGQGVASGRMIRSVIQKPTALSLTPSLTDTVQYTDEELYYIRAQSGAPAGVRGYCLENEPGIWDGTHPCAHPARATCGEVLNMNGSLNRLKRALRQIVDDSPSSLRAAVAAEALYYSDDAEIFFNDLLSHGCASGMIGSLIYYCDTHTFYDMHYDEIEALRIDVEESLGESLKPNGDLKNFYAWFGFEETARMIAGEIGILE